MLSLYVQTPWAMLAKVFDDEALKLYKQRGHQQFVDDFQSTLEYALKVVPGRKLIDLKTVKMVCLLFIFVIISKIIIVLATL